ncbi:MAG TPA: branched-chain amino acid ABC transporter permease [Burkholderiales bacterium]|nr:branched-chain amino acid ABC transporter permease [Burkholderiales bacterium]
MPLDLLLEAVLFGILLGGFYAAVSMGLSVSFGLLDVPNVAHPAIMVLGSYCTYVVVSKFGLDPIVAGLALTPLFFILGMAIYRFYYELFERRGGREAGVRGIAFFFGFALIIEVGLILVFGVDQRMVEAPYIGKSIDTFHDIRIPLRTLTVFAVAVVLTIALTLYMSNTFTGRAIKAVAQDEAALRLMGANPVRIKQWAFGIATAASVIAGAMLIIVGPVEPGMDRVYIGRTFAVVVLAGLGSMTGTVIAGLILGISESIVLMHPVLGASWAPAVSFLLLLVMLGVRPQGLFGR